MSSLYLIIAVLFVLAGLAASYFAPTENMGVREAFYAHLILVAPPFFVGTVISALAMIMRKLDRLIEKTGSELRAAAPAKIEDFGSQFIETPQADQTIVAQGLEPEILYEEMAAESIISEPEPQPPAAARERRAPTIDEFLVKGSNNEFVPPSPPRLVREGTFAGRHYRMFEDGSLEIDTEQSTIRFDSLDEFRSFVSSAANG